jgi:hypothetical protein
MAKTRWRDCFPVDDFEGMQGACSVPRNAKCMIRTLRDVDVIDALEIFAVYVEAAASLTGGDQCNDVGLPDRIGLITHCTGCTAVHQWEVSTCRLILVSASGINRNQISNFFFLSATNFNCCQIPSHQRGRMERLGAAVSLNKSVNIIDLRTASPEDFIPVIASAPTFRTVIQP